MIRRSTKKCTRPNALDARVLTNLYSQASCLCPETMSIFKFSISP